MRALEAVRRVCNGYFLSSDQIELALTLQHPKTPLFRLNGSGADCQWFNFNQAGHNRMVFSAGFEIERESKPYVIEFNKHPSHIPLSPRSLARKAGTRYLTGGNAVGVLHHAVLGKPRI